MSWPARTPVNASPAPLRPPPHDSGSSWVANPSTQSVLISFSMPVYPGAPRLLLHHHHPPRPRYSGPPLCCLKPHLSLHFIPPSPTTFAQHTQILRSKQIPPQQGEREVDGGEAEQERIAEQKRRETTGYATFLPDERFPRLSPRWALSVCFGRMAGTGPGHPHPFGTGIDRVPDAAGTSHLQLPLLQRLAPNQPRAEVPAEAMLAAGISWRLRP